VIPSPRRTEPIPPGCYPRVAGRPGEGRPTRAARDGSEAPSGTASSRSRRARRKAGFRESPAVASWLVSASTLSGRTCRESLQQDEVLGARVQVDQGLALHGASRGDPADASAGEPRVPHRHEAQARLLEPAASPAVSRSSARTTAIPSPRLVHGAHVEDHVARPCVPDVGPARGRAQDHALFASSASLMARATRKSEPGPDAHPVARLDCGHRGESRAARKRASAEKQVHDPMDGGSERRTSQSTMPEGTRGRTREARPRGRIASGPPESRKSRITSRARRRDMPPRFRDDPPTPYRPTRRGPRPGSPRRMPTQSCPGSRVTASERHCPAKVVSTARRSTTEQLRPRRQPDVLVPIQTRRKPPRAGGPPVRRGKSARSNGCRGRAPARQRRDSRGFSGAIMGRARGEPVRLGIRLCSRPR